MRVVDVLRQNSILDNGRVVDLLLSPRQQGPDPGPGSGAYYITTPFVIGNVKEDLIVGEVVENEEILANLPEVESDGLVEETFEPVGTEQNEEIKGTIQCP